MPRENIKPIIYDRDNLNEFRVDYRKLPPQLADMRDLGNFQMLQGLARVPEVTGVVRTRKVMQPDTLDVLTSVKISTLPDSHRVREKIEEATASYQDAIERFGGDRKPVLGEILSIDASINPDFAKSQRQFVQKYNDLADNLGRGGVVVFDCFVGTPVEPITHIPPEKTLAIPKDKLGDIRPDRYDDPIDLPNMGAIKGLGRIPEIYAVIASRGARSNYFDLVVDLDIFREFERREEVENVMGQYQEYAKNAGEKKPSEHGGDVYIIPGDGLEEIIEKYLDFARDRRRREVYAVYYFPDSHEF